MFLRFVLFAFAVVAHGTDDQYESNTWIQSRSGREDVLSADAMDSMAAAVQAPASPVADVNNNNNAGSTRMTGLDMLSDFFDWISNTCKPNPKAKKYSEKLILEVCKYLPKFGLVWNQPGNYTTKTVPACNIHGCQCIQHANRADRKFFWFGVHVPASPAGGVAGLTWSGGGICLSLRTNAAGTGISPGTGSIKLQTSLFDIIGNFLGPAKKKALKAVLAILKTVAIGFSTDHSLAISLEGQPTLLVNARRRNGEVTATCKKSACTSTKACGGSGTDKAECKSDAADSTQYTSDKEYFWACKYHHTWAFPVSQQAQSWCKALNGNLWLHITVALPNVLKKTETQPAASSAGGKANKPFDIAGLFSFSMDIALMFSVDNLATLSANFNDAIESEKSYNLFLALLTIDFSILCSGSVTVTLGLKKFSGGLFGNWVIKMAALLLYFRKGGGTAAFYLTYSLGSAATSLDTLAMPKCNKPAAMDTAKSLYDQYAADKVKDALKTGGADLAGSFIPTGLQLQIYVILTGCSGTFPDIVCNFQSKTIGFGFKVALLTLSGGYSAFIEKPLENPASGKADTLLLCISDMNEAEPACLNLGFLLELLNILGALADLVLEVGQAIGKVFESVGKFVDAIVGLVGACFPAGNTWMRRRHWCADHWSSNNAFKTQNVQKYCWGPLLWINCGDNPSSPLYGVDALPGCRLWGLHPMCLNGKIDNGGGCAGGHSTCKSGFCKDKTCTEKANDGSTCPGGLLDAGVGCKSGKCRWTVDWGKTKCCASDVCNGLNCWCASLAVNAECDWSDQCNTRWCDGKKCKNKLNNGQTCSSAHSCNSNKCRWTVRWGKTKCCSADICNLLNCWCKSLNNGSECDWGEQCNSRNCSGWKCQDNRRRRERRRRERRRRTRRRRKLNNGSQCDGVWHGHCNSNKCAIRADRRRRDRQCCSQTEWGWLNDWCKDRRRG